MINERGLSVEFFLESVEQLAESKQCGFPVFKEVPHVRIAVPGDPYNVVCHIATQGHKDMYPMAWQTFNNQNQPVIDGMPIKEWPVINRSQVQMAHFYNVMSVEQLAELSDVNMSRMGAEWRELRDKARAYLKYAEDNKELARTTAENEALKQKLADLEEQTAAKPKSRATKEKDE